MCCVLHTSPLPVKLLPALFWARRMSDIDSDVNLISNPPTPHPSERDLGTVAALNRGWLPFIANSGAVYTEMPVRPLLK